MATYRYVRLTVTRRRGSILVVDNTTGIGFDGYRYITGNDAEDRDPVSWAVAGSNDGIAWTHLDERQSQTITASRNTATSVFTLSGGAVNYRYVRFSVGRVKVTGGLVQYDDFQVTSGGSPVAWNGGVTATNPGGTAAGGEGPASAVDNNTATKMLDDNFGVAAENGCQFSELTLTQGGSNVAWNGGATATNPGGTNPGGEGGPQAIDGSTTTKLHNTAHTVDGNLTAYGTTVLHVDNTTGITFDGYKITTANDETKRDPSSWTLEGSDDNSNWTLLNTRVGESLPAARQTASGIYSLDGGAGPTLALMGQASY